MIPSRTAFISKSREKSREKEEEVKKEEKDEVVVKIPSYLNLLLNLFYFPLAFIYKVLYKVYSVVSFIICLPSRISQGFQYLATLPWVLVDKASRFPTLLIEWTCRNLEGLLQLCIDYQVGGILCFAVLFWLWPLPDMTYPLFAILRLVLGTLYPAYASFKAVRTKNVREYVKWMMYWIVFAIFSSLETFADIFVAFWFPFYYEVKILLLIWLISPVSKGSLGSSIIYRRFVHPNLIVREDEIDRMICRLQEQGYNTVTKLAVKGFNYISNMVMQTAIRAPELMTDFVIEAQRLQQSAAQNNTTQSSIDTTDHPEPRFVEVMETEEFNEDSFETETNNLMEDEQDNSPSQKLPEKVKAKKKATRNSRKTSKKTSAAEVVLSSDDDDTGKPDDPDYKPRMRTRSKSKKNA